MRRSESSSEKNRTDTPSRENALLDGILKDAEREMRSIKTQTDKSVSERKMAAEQQVQVIRREADAKIREQIASIEKKTASRISMETHRISLRERDRMVQEISREVFKKLEDATAEEDYAAVLQVWIVEAMIGLDVEQAQVNASRAEKPLIQRELLRKAEMRIQELAGRKVQLRKSNKAPLLSQGVVLEAEDGRLVFNNQVSTRMLRYQSEIRKLIASVLSGDRNP